MGAAILTIPDDAYPALLREISDPPPVLYVLGALEPDDEVRLAVVGSRRATGDGLAVAEGMAVSLARAGIAVVSGLARGIDGAAHRGALLGGGRTLAVLGSGLGKIYPVEHAELAEKVRGQGAVLSEFPLDLGPLKRNFPRRNRIISGLTAGTIVVEAAQASGALVTARLALEQGREAFAVPGSILSAVSAGTNGLLRAGAAHMVTRSQDVLDELPAVFRLRLGLSAAPSLTAIEPAADESEPAEGASESQGDGNYARREDLEAVPTGPAGATGPRREGPEHAGDPSGERSGERSRPPGGKLLLMRSFLRSRFGGKGRPPARRSPEEQDDDAGPEISRAPGRSGPTSLGGLSEDEIAVARHLTPGRTVTIDELSALSGLPAPRFLAALSSLEIRGMAVMLAGSRVGAGGVFRV